MTMDDASKLQEYAELEGTEWGTTAHMLINMWYQRSLLSEHLIEAIEKEIVDWLQDCQLNAKIVEETFIPTPYTIKTVEWND